LSSDTKADSSDYANPDLALARALKKFFRRSGENECEKRPVNIITHSHFETVRRQQKSINLLNLL